jgi:hypothetical protein
MSATATASPALMYSMVGMSSVSALGTGYSQSQAIKATGRYQSGIAETNAAMADLAGKETLEAGDIQASRKNLETQQRVGSRLAIQGASGVDVGSGSSAMVRSGDELTIRSNAQRRAFGYKIQSMQDTYQAKFAKMTAASESMQTLLSGGLKVISEPLSIYSNYLRFSRYMGGGAGGKVPDSYTSGSEGVEG